MSRTILETQINVKDVERIRLPSSPKRAWVVLMLAIGAPLQSCALFFSSGDLMLAVFGLYVAAIIVVMTSRYFMDELSFEREVDFSLQIGAVMCGSFVISCWLGTSIHYWSIYSNTLTVEPTTLKRPLRDSIRLTGLPLYDFSHLSFQVSRSHVGQFSNDDGTVVCVAPLAMRKQLAKTIETVDDVPPNWAACRGIPPPAAQNVAIAADADADDDDTTFDCGAYYRSATASDEDRIDALNVDMAARDSAAAASKAGRESSALPDELSDSVTFDTSTLLGCLRGWASATRGHDLNYVDTDYANTALQAAKEALQRWAPLADDAENPLQTFDDDSDLRHLTFVRLERSCCAVHTARYSFSSLLSFTPNLRRYPGIVGIAAFVVWIGALFLIMSTIPE